MASIPVTRAELLLPYMSLLEEMGAPTEALLAQHRLPVELKSSLGGYLPTFNAIRFIEMSGRDQGIADFGFLASRTASFDALSVRMRRLILDSPTLYSALRNLCISAELESSHVRHFLYQSGDSIRLCGQLSGARGLLHRENFQWTKIAFPIQVIREFIGPEWAPRTIAFGSRYKPGIEAQQHWPRTQFISGQNCTWIDIPCKYLGNSAIRIAPSYPEDDTEGATIGDVLKSLKLIIPSYFGGKIPSVSDAADMANMSLRSFQRALGDMGVSYRDIVSDARFERASIFLRRTDISISELASALGYADVAHFSRAFRRVAGLSPLQYRHFNGEQR